MRADATGGRVTCDAASRGTAWPHHSAGSSGLPTAPGDYFFRVSIRRAKGDVTPDVSTLSIVHDQVSVARSYAKVV